MKARIAAGLRMTIDAARRSKETAYPLWPRGADHPTEFAVFAEDRYFFTGLFFANLSTFANATDTHFVLGRQPRLVAVFADNLNSWDEVDLFLARQKTPFRIPAGMTRPAFTGCNVIKTSSDGFTTSAVLVVDIGAGHPLDQVQTCVYRTLAATFGYEPSAEGRDVISDIETLRALYRLKKEDRGLDGLVDAVAKGVNAK